MRRAVPPAITLTVLAVSVCGYSLAATQLLPALPRLQVAFGASPSAVAWVFTAYLLVSAPATPLAGRLGDMYGRRPVLVAVLTLFLIASIGSALAHNLPELIAWRALQGLGGAVVPLAFGVVADVLPEKRVSLGMAMLGAMLAIGGSVGLLLGGFLVQHAPVGVIFWTSAGFGLIGVVGSLLTVPRSAGRTAGRLDVAGAALLAVGLVTPLIGVSFAPRWGWGDPRALALFAAGLVVLPLWWRLQARRPAPLVDTALLTSRPIAATILATAVMGFGLFGAFSLVPQLAQAPEAVGGLGFTALGAGVLMLPTATVNAAVAPLVGLVSRAHGSKLPLLAGALIAAAGLAWLSARHASPAEIAIGCGVLGIGFAASLAAAPNIIVGWAPRDRTGAALAANTLAQNLGSSVGSQVGVSIVASRVGADGLIPAGYTWAFAVAAGMAVVGAGFAALVLEPPVTVEETTLLT
ncbi:MFS transporter [Paractinoplanes rhizophilus]|uniref:MFS transporter n=1 Tax=Paractinoplanes rhizophilus TaxID=1416877 RepID=A0ABW2I4U1_9ACTN|nr:MFS transporter [Actinoplanes sp.]